MFALRDSVPKGFEKTARSMQLERHFGNQAEVDVLAGQGSIRSNKSRLSPHQLHQADAIRRTNGLDMRAGDSFHGLCKRRFKTKTLVQVWDVVVDRFGYSNDAFAKTSMTDLRNEGGGAFESAIPPNHE